MTLSLLGVILRFYRPEVSIISWPASSLLSVYLLSLILFLVQRGLNNVFRVISVLIAFSMLHWILSGFLDIILTRFFRLEEYYELQQFTDYLLDHLTRISDGALMCGAYLLVFSWINIKRKSEISQQEKKSLEKLLDSSELTVLNTQVNPHFLFNAMNGIAMKVRLGENKLAVKMIAALNDLLRLSLSKDKDELISLGEEIVLLHQYLTIEQTRFGEDFILMEEIDDDLLSYKVPKLILQPLVENAFKHGMKNALEKMVLKLKGNVEDQLVLTVYNSQGDLQKINYANSNIGLPNVVHRLKRFFGTSFQFQSFSEKDGIAFKITIPIVK